MNEKNGATGNTDEDMRPIAVHVEKIMYNPTLAHIYRKRIAVIDLELTPQHVEDLIRNLQEMNIHDITIRLRFKGRMVLE